MPPRKGKAGGSSSSKKDEIQVSKSPAEFFAENQSIAGFDNPVSLCDVFLFCLEVPYFDVQVILTTTLSLSHV